MVLCSELSKGLNQITATLNPLHSKIRIHILHTVLYTYPKVADKENLFNNQMLL